MLSHSAYGAIFFNDAGGKLTERCRQVTHDTFLQLRDWGTYRLAALTLSFLQNLEKL